MLNVPSTLPCERAEMRKFMFYYPKYIVDAVNTKLSAVRSVLNNRCVLFVVVTIDKIIPVKMKKTICYFHKSPCEPWSQITYSLKVT